MSKWKGLEQKQKEAIRFLTNSYRKKRLVHAYIFEGPKGVGKLSIAKSFAKMVLCHAEAEFCGTCRHCEMVEQGQHVNVIQISPEGQSIKKEQIQSLQQEFAKMGAENAAKVYIIENADKMSISASNSLLKFLEEPAQNTYALLLTENSEKLLATIRSRAILLSLKPLAKDRLLEKFREEGIGKYASLAASLTQNLDEAREFGNSESFSKLVELLVRVEEAIQKTGFDPSVALAQSQSLMKEPGAAQLFLKLYTIFYRDILALKLELKQTPGFSFHPDALEYSKDANEIQDCVRKLKAIMNAERRLMANANAALTFDQLFLEMKGGSKNGI